MSGISKVNKALRIYDAVVTHRRVSDDVLDVYRDKMTKVAVSAGGRDTGPDSAKAHRKTRVEFDEVDGKRAKVNRVIDTLGQMKTRGTITEAMYKAGIAFQLDFDIGQWESMPSMRFDGMPRSGKANGMVSLQVIDARGAVLDAIAALGGAKSPCGIAVWWVIGMRWSIKQLVNERNDKNLANARHETITGTLIGALGMLAVHYNYSTADKPS